MATSVVESYSGSGTYWWTDSRTVSATTKNALYTLQGESNWPTYNAVAKGVITTTANAHMLFIQADGTNYTRIKRIYIRQSTLSGAVNTVDISLIRTSTAGTGGGAISARPMNAADTDPYAGTIQTLPTGKGTETNTVGTLQCGVVITNPMTTANEALWQEIPGLEPIILGTANTDGLCIKQINAVATNKLDIWVTFAVTPWL